MYFFISYFDVNTSTVYVGDTMSTDPLAGFSKDLRNSIRKRNHDNKLKKEENRIKEINGRSKARIVDLAHYRMWVK